ncbi:hypothetical protein QTN94_19075 [Vibrio sp. M250220]|uniref:hypothetical protein n=1 Tax=Vibrio sp. M250220 TaxID=3020894 RepID=UPI002F40D872
MKRNYPVISKEDLIPLLGEKTGSSLIYKFVADLVWPVIEEEVIPGEKYLICDKGGFSLLFEADELTAVHLYCSDNEDGYSSYNGWVGDGVIGYEVSIEDMIKLQGTPSKRGGGEQGFMGMLSSPWLRYDKPEFVIHYTFSADSSHIVNVTLMSINSAP